jgi:hypothetical protein
VWTYEITDNENGGSVLTHHFRMGDPTEGIKGITADMNDADRQRFLTEWGKKLEVDLAATLDRVRAVVER